jgi:hypothetical protein
MLNAYAPTMRAIHRQTPHFQSCVALANTASAGLTHAPGDERLD